MAPSRFVKVVTMVVLAMAVLGPRVETQFITKTLGESACESMIYCQGDLLHIIQLARLFNDSKTFVDLRLRQSVSSTWDHFMEMMEKFRNGPPREEVRKFVDIHFQRGDDLDPADLPDWIEKPIHLSKISDPNLREWAYNLNKRWKDLSKKVPDHIKEEDERTSLMYVPNRFVVPGGRFNELYYWDTFWIVRGLMICGMTDTARGMIENLLYLLRNNGIIPNGSRIYYKQRSQPPLLIPMVNEYVKTTGDVKFLEENIHLLEKEYLFWVNNRSVQITWRGETHTFVRYYSDTKGPRPESYREDYFMAQHLRTEDERQAFYYEIKSAAESGWDFSSRWFLKNDSLEGDLLDIHVRNVIPVDLNSIMCGNAILLSRFFTEMGNEDKATHYKEEARKWQEAIEMLMWNEAEGSWFDYDMMHGKQRILFYGSNVAPLWTECYDKKKETQFTPRVIHQLESLERKDFHGGIPASLLNTGEQWDYPNAWPPVQYIIIEGLDQTKIREAKELALKLAKTWIKSNYKAYVEEGHMYEKYDSRFTGAYGGGGEYQVQMGFGWTNGVALHLLNKYKDELTAEEIYRKSRRFNKERK